MKNLNRREKILISVLLIAVVSYAYFTYFLSPLLDKTNIARTQISAYKSQLTEIQNILANNAKYQEDYNKALEKYKEYTVIMPYTPRDPELVYNLKKLSDKAAATVNSVGVNVADQGNSGQAQPGLDSSIIPVQININFSSNSYVNAMRFVNLFEKDSRLAQIDTLNLSKGSGGNSNSGVSGTIAANYYYMKNTSPGAIDYNFNNGKYGKSDLFK